MTSNLDLVRKGFIDAGVPSALTEELLESFSESKRRFYLSDLRPSAVEGGRFSEAALRVLEWTAFGQFTPLSDSKFKAETVINKLGALPANQHSDSLRLHIPRTIRLIYDIRNKRDTAHLTDGIDPNFQDATLVVRNMEWILAELVRLHHTVSANEAHRLITDLVSKEVPMIQVFDGFPRLLKDVAASDHCLVLLYWRGSEGADLSDLVKWVKPKMRANLKRTLGSLDTKNLVHCTDSKYQLTIKGEQLVESRGLIAPV
jgi:hypothetical protein